MAMTLVIGGTGNVGQVVVPGLLAAGQQVRVLTRDPTSEVARSQAEAGAAMVHGDLDDGASLDAALDGVDRVLVITTPTPQQKEQALAVIEAVKRSAPDAHFVRLSAMAPEPELDFELGRQHHEIDQAIKSSGLRWTILRPTFFMQNLIGAAGGVIADGNLYQPFKDGILPMIDVRDTADSFVAVLTGDGHEGKTYKLTGNEAIGMDRVAQALSKATGNHVTYVAVPTEAAEQSFIEAGYPEWVAHAFCELFEGFANNGLTRVSDGVEQLTDHSPRTVDDFATDFGTFFQAS